MTYPIQSFILNNIIGEIINGFDDMATFAKFSSVFFIIIDTM